MTEPIPHTQDIEFKEKFIERYSKLTDFETFRKISLSWLRKSIRVNTLKITVPELKKRLEKDWQLTPVPWCKEGFWIKGTRLDIGNLPEHILGYIYVQEAASMIPPVVLGPKPGEVILDLCAAPGSKTTQIAQMMKNTGVLIANDIDHKRLSALGINTQRCGVSNILITQMQGRYFKESGVMFDRILADVPCSATGTIRKSLKTISMWNPHMIRKIAGEQRQLAKTAFDILKPGGTMIYSTCSLEPEEDEGVVSHLLDTYDNLKIEQIDLDIKRSKAVMEFEGKSYNKEVSKCLRIWPQDNDTEGFFVTKIKKQE